MAAEISENKAGQLFVWPKYKELMQRQQEHQVEQQPSTSFADVIEKSREIEVGTVQIVQPQDRDESLENNASQHNNISVQDTPFAVHLIEEVRRYPCVWNISLQSFKDKPKKMEAWRRISAVLNIPENVLTKEFDRLRDNYRRCIRKRETMTRSGSANKKLPICDYFVELSFLRDVVTGRKTESNVHPVEATTSVCSDNSSTCFAVQLDEQTDTTTQPQSTIKDTKAVRNARKRRSDQLDELLAVSLAQDLKSGKSTQEMTSTKSEDQDVLFCSSLVNSFQKLKGKSNKQAKMKVLEVLLEFEDDNIDIA